MTWTETTVLWPEVWGPRVERDLREGLRTQLTNELTITESFDADFDAACVGARELLASATGPQVVTLTPGRAELVAHVIPTDEERAAHEERHEDARRGAIAERERRDALAAVDIAELQAAVERAQAIAAGAEG